MAQRKKEIEQKLNDEKNKNKEHLENIKKGVIANKKKAREKGRLNNNTDINYENLADFLDPNAHPQPQAQQQPQPQPPTTQDTTTTKRRRPQKH